MINWLRLGSRIQEMRRYRQITQQQLAERARISDVFLGYIEQGKRRCSIETYIRIANALGYTLDDLFGEYLQRKPMPGAIKSLLSEFDEEEEEEIMNLMRSLISLAKRKKGAGSHYYSNYSKGT